LRKEGVFKGERPDLWRIAEGKRAKEVPRTRGREGEMWYSKSGGVLSATTAIRGPNGKITSDRIKRRRKKRGLKGGGTEWREEHYESSSRKTQIEGKRNSTKRQVINHQGEGGEK